MGKSSAYGPADGLCDGHSNRRLHAFWSRRSFLSRRTNTLLRGRRAASQSLPARIKSSTKKTIAVWRRACGRSGGHQESLRASSAMALCQSVYSHRSNARGFFTVTLVTLIPLLMTVVLAVAGVENVMKQKLRAQSLCVKAALRLQSDLGEILDSLLKLNPEATRLRAERKVADARLAAAIVTANPYAITLARAYKASVVLRQGALRAKQLILLSKAQLKLSSQTQELRIETKKLGGLNFQRRDFDFRPLAVSAAPKNSASPSYDLVSPFERRQTKIFSFDVLLFARVQPLSWRQQTRCATTLKKESLQWKPKIQLANALSKRFWP